MFSWKETPNMCWWWGIVFIFLVACRQTELRIPVVLDKFPVDVHGPTDIVINSQTGYVYVIDYNNRIGVLKGLEQVAILEMEADAFTADLAVDETGNWVYVVDKYGHRVAVIQGTKVIDILETDVRQPNAVAVEPTSGWAYVVGPYGKDRLNEEEPVLAGHVTILDGPKLIETIHLRDVLPHHIVADPVHGYVYVAGSQLTDDSPIGAAIEGVIIVFKGVEEIARLETLLPVQALDINPKTGDVFASGPDQHLYQLKEGKLVNTLQVIEGNGSIRNLRVHPERGDVYLVAWGEQTEIIVVRKHKVIGKIPLQGTGLKMTIDPVTGNVYVADYWFNTVTAIHGAEVIATLETGLYPYGIAVNPANGQVYISNTNEGTITVLGLP